jgi:hypothetical protein
MNLSTLSMFKGQTSLVVYLNAKLTHIKVYAEALRSYSDLERATGMNFPED